MLSDLVVLPTNGIAHAPESLDFAGASTLACAGMTAWNAVHGDHPPGPGSQVLILGSGGVSLFALPWARFATLGNDAKLATRAARRRSPRRALLSPCA